MDPTLCPQLRTLFVHHLNTAPVLPAVAVYVKPVGREGLTHRFSCIRPAQEYESGERHPLAHTSSTHLAYEL